MKLKSAMKYLISDFSKSFITFYLIILFLNIASVVIEWTGRGEIHSNSGMEVASIIFIFICGLSSFKTPFHMLLANGVSRKTMFTSSVASLLPLSAGMALIDSIFHLIFSPLSSHYSFFSHLYQTRYAGPDGSLTGISLQSTLEGFLWMFFLYAAVALFGFFITTLYYRMNRALKLTVSIGVPVLLFVVMPYADIFIFHGQLFKSFAKAIAAAFGFLNGCNPYIAMLSCAGVFIIFGLFTFLLIRRATIKE